MADKKVVDINETKADGVEVVKAGEVEVVKAGEVEVVKTDALETKDRLVYTLKRPIDFEGKHYTEIDLRGLRTCTGKDYRDAERYMATQGMLTQPLEENSEPFTMYLASRAAGVPIELLEAMDIRDIMAVKNRVSGFFYSEE